MPYYEGLNRMADAAHRRERAEQRMRAARIVVPAVVVVLMLSAVTRLAMEEVISFGLVIALLVGLWQVFTGRL